MSSQLIAIGTEIATARLVPSQSLTVPVAAPSTLKDLVDITRSRTEKNDPMLRSTAARLSELLNQTPDQIAIEALVDISASLGPHLRERHYSDNSVRTYCQNARRLLALAKKQGWISDKKSIEEEWAPFLVALQGIRQAQKKIIAFAVQNSIAPADFTDRDLDAWAEAMLAAGRQYRSVRLGKWNFRRALKEAGLVLPGLGLQKPQPRYKVLFQQLPEPLRSEVQELLEWKQARYAKGRPQWTRHRAVSAKLLEGNICRLYGFARDIGRFADIDSLSTLFTELVVAAFVAWGVNTRNMKRTTLLRLSMLYGAMRHHPKYASTDFSWFSPLFDEIPPDDRVSIQEKKATKYVPHKVLRTIPGKIRQARSELEASDIKRSWLAHDELLIVWLTTLPWRQRNLRECRVGAPESANLFFAPLPSLAHVARPQWVEDALKTDPQHSVWQFYFREGETKAAEPVRGVLPRCLIPLLEEYLIQHRPKLVSSPDPGTLFLNRDGRALSRQTLSYQIPEIVRKYAGRGMNPHLFRDAFAYAWLESHPEDYLTLSKCLWHGTVQYTLSVYGANFDESNGARRIDEWLPPEEET